jgi:hypothetical protein
VPYSVATAYCRVCFRFSWSLILTHKSFVSYLGFRTQLQAEVCLFSIACFFFGQTRDSFLGHGDEWLLVLTLATLVLHSRVEFYIGVPILTGLGIALVFIWRVYTHLLLHLARFVYQSHRLWRYR